MSLRQLLDLVGLSLGGPLDGGDELLLRAGDLLLLDGDLLLALHHLNLDLLQPDLLLLLGPLQLIGQLGLCFLEEEGEEEESRSTTIHLYLLL